MAKLISLYTCHEAILDKKGNEVAYHETNLPHADEVAEAFLKEWNEDADWMVGIMNEQVGKDRIASCRARRYKKDEPKVTIAVEIVAKEGKQFRGTMKEDIFEFMGSQYCDGWGEGFFGVPRKAKDGTRFAIK